MKRATMYVLSTLCSLALIVAILFTCLQVAMNDESWFMMEYVKLDTARGIDMSNSDVAAAMRQMIDYMEGREESIDIKVKVNGKSRQMFNDREREHMVDVQKLYQGFRTFRNIAAPLAIVVYALICLVMRHDAIKALSKGFIIAAIVFGVIAATAAIWVAIDFSSFWTVFHLLFFTNDLWLLDPATSRMILICPEQLFFDIVVRFGVWFMVIFALLTAASAIYLNIRKRRRNSPLISKEDDDYDNI